jgi:hypothetical protein
MSSAIYETPPLFAAISVTASGEIVAAISGRKVRILSLVLIAAGAVTVKFQSATTDLEGAMSLITGVPVTLPYNPVGWAQTASGEALNIVLGGAVQVSGFLTYQSVDATLQP